MSLLHLLSYVGAAVAFIFVTLSLASGLLWLSELIEEHSRPAKVIGQRGIYVIILIHMLLYFYDSLPLRHILFSVACHIIYLQNFTPSWPFISLSSWSFIASCIVVVVDHFMWFFYFAHITQEARQRSRSVYRGTRSSQDVPGFADIATFFGICVWLAPLFLFLSLSANDNALPMNLNRSATTPATPSTPSRPSPAIQGPRGSLFKALYDSLPPLRRSRRRDAPQGIIAPLSPNLRPSSPTPSPGLRRSPSSSTLQPQPSPTPSRRGSYELSPSLYSGGGYLSPEPGQESSVRSHDGLSPLVLGPPPRRASTSGNPVRRTTADGRLEMRRTTSSSSGGGSGFRLDD
ncbi:DUF396-domain-containing protein [Panus rudis PR-1116 ss-1]|nr:DUF396-domain-containing protein [Panus rudis PR-1116 ss-1]